MPKTPNMASKIENIYHLVGVAQNHVYPYKTPTIFCLSVFFPLACTWLVSLAAVFSLVMQHSWVRGALHDKTKNGCGGD